MLSLVTITYLSEADLFLTQGVLCAEHLTNPNTGQSWGSCEQTELWSDITPTQGRMYYMRPSPQSYHKLWKGYVYQSSSEDYKPSAGNLFASSKQCV